MCYMKGFRWEILSKQLQEYKKFWMHLDLKFKDDDEVDKGGAQHLTHFTAWWNNND